MHSARWLITLAFAWRDGHCPLWITIHSHWNETNLSSFQDNANKYQPWFTLYSFFYYFPLFTLLSAHRAFLSFFRVEWKVSLLLRIKAEEKPGPGLIHVAHTGGMLCMDNWLSKQHGHCWILMVLPKCHLTDVTAAPILKRLVSKASIQSTLLSHCVWERQHCLSGFYFRGTDLAFATLSAQDSAPTSRRALNISNHRDISLCF